MHPKKEKALRGAGFGAGLMCANCYKAGSSGDLDSIVRL